MSRDKRHQTIDNSQSVSTSLFQVSQKVLRFSTDWCYEVLRFAFQHLRCILKIHWSEILDTVDAFSRSTDRVIKSADHWTGHMGIIVVAYK